MYRFQYQPSPRNTLLDLMGVHPRHQLETSQLGLISDAFEVSVNNLRVTLNRLVSAELVRSDERGVYALTEKALTKRRFIDRWKTPNLARAQWDGGWAACHLPRGGERKKRKRSMHALDLNGFKAGLDQVWIRPDNLNTTLPELHARLLGLGLEPGAHCFVLSEVDELLASDWAKTLWPVQSLDREYTELIDLLNTSEKSLATQSAESSLAETCQLGAEAIFRLSADPLLPQAIRPGDRFERLQNITLRYDRLGREIWLEQLEALGVSE